MKVDSEANIQLVLEISVQSYYVPVVKILRRFISVILRTLQILQKLKNTEWFCWSFTKIVFAGTGDFMYRSLCTDIMFHKMTGH